MNSNTAPINRLALVSFLLAGLTMVSFCIGVVPIPLTAWVCYPLALVLGVSALVSGLRALRQLGSGQERGRLLAQVAIGMGALSLLAVVCFTSLTVLLYVYGIEAIKSYCPR